MAQSYSFYGGKAGFSFKIVQRFDAIYFPPSTKVFQPGNYKPGDIVTYNNKFYVFNLDNPTTVTNWSLKQWQEVQGMVNCFMLGGGYMGANYGEYVIIDTILKCHNESDPTNGMIYRRGMNWQEPPVMPVSKDAYMHNGALLDDSFRRKMYNWVWRPGADAEYIGQVVGPKGETPIVSIIKDLDMFASEDYLDNGGFVHATSESYAGTSGGVNKDNYDLDSLDHKPTNKNEVPRNTISSYYTTIVDNNGNVVGADLAFTFPYHVYQIHSQSISPYANVETGDIVFDIKDSLYRAGAGARQPFSQYSIYYTGVREDATGTPQTYNNSETKELPGNLTIVLDNSLDSDVSFAITKILGLVVYDGTTVAEDITNTVNYTIGSSNNKKTVIFDTIYYTTPWADYSQRLSTATQKKTLLKDPTHPTTGGYQNLVTKVAGGNDTHPYWSEWDIKVPNGKQGDSTEEVWIDRNQEMHMVTRNYDYTSDGALVDANGDKITNSNNLTDHAVRYHSQFVDDSTSRQAQEADAPVRIKVIDYVTQGKATDGATATGGRSGMQGKQGYNTKKNNARSLDTTKILDGVDEDHTSTYLPKVETKYQSTWYTTPDKTAQGYNDDPDLNTATTHVYEEDTVVVREIDCIRIENDLSENAYIDQQGNIQNGFVKTARIKCYYSDDPGTGVPIGEVSAIKKLWRGTTERNGVLKDHLLVRYRYEADDAAHIHDLGLIPTLEGLGLRNDDHIDSGISGYVNPDGTPVTDTSYIHIRTGDNVTSCDLVATYSNANGDGLDLQVKLGEFASIAKVWRGPEDGIPNPAENDHWFLRYVGEPSTSKHDLGYITNILHDPTSTDPCGVTMHPQSDASKDYYNERTARKADIHVNYSDGTYEIPGTSTGGITEIWIGDEYDGFYPGTTTLRPDPQRYCDEVVHSVDIARQYYLNHLLIRFEYEPATVFHDLGYVKGAVGSYELIKVDSNITDQAAQIAYLNTTYPDGYYTTDFDESYYVGRAIQMGDNEAARVFLYSDGSGHDINGTTKGWYYVASIGITPDVTSKVVMNFHDGSDADIESGVIPAYDPDNDVHTDRVFGDLYKDAIGMIFNDKTIDTGARVPEPAPEPEPEP